MKSTGTSLYAVSPAWKSGSLGLGTVSDQGSSALSRATLGAESFHFLFNHQLLLFQLAEVKICRGGAFIGLFNTGG